MKSAIPIDWQVPELFRKRLGASAGRQRAMAEGGHLLLVLHQPPEPGVPERRGRVFWRDAEGEWTSNCLGSGVQALKRHLAEYAEAIEKLEKRWGAADSARDYFVLLRALAPLHRTTRHLHATLQQARELLPDDRDLINLRDQAGDLERALELLHADARNGLEFTTAYQTEQQAERAHEMAVSAYRLNLLVATFFPIATLSAIFSMHLPHGLDELTHPPFFWGLLAFGLICGVGLATVISARPRASSAPTKVRDWRKP
jgi:hypothetical protein